MAQTKIVDQFYDRGLADYLAGATVRAVIKTSNDIDDRTISEYDPDAVPSYIAGFIHGLVQDIRKISSRM